MDLRNIEISGKAKKQLKMGMLFLVIVGIASIIVNILTDGQGTICIIANTTGFPCPTCGLTRSVMYTLKLDFKSAIEYNPLIIILPFSVLALGYGVIKEDKKFLSKVIYIIGGIAVVVWVIRMFMYFPNVEPMIYREKSLFGVVFGFIQDIIN